jgi:cell division protein FtsL
MGRVPFLIMSFVLTGALLFGVVTLQAILSQTSFRMGRLERQGTELRQNYGQLKLEVARLSAPGRIAHEAKRLGLRLPDPSQVRTLSVQAPTPVATTPVSGTAPSFALKSVLGEEP